MILLALFAIASPIKGVAVSGWCATSLPDFDLYQFPRQAEDISMLNSDGNVFRLSDLKGHVVILNFWRRDCPYCVQEKAFLKRVSQSIGSSDLKIICANFWDSPTWVKSHGGDMGREILVTARVPGVQSVIENVVKGRLMGYFVLNEAKEAVYEVKGFPSTYIIDRRGFVVASHVGMAKWSSGPIEKWLRMLLADNRQRDSYPDGTDSLERLMVIKPSSSLSDKDLSPASNGQHAR